MRVYVVRETDAYSDPLPKSYPEGVYRIRDNAEARRRDWSMAHPDSYFRVFDMEVLDAPAQILGAADGVDHGAYEVSEEVEIPACPLCGSAYPVYLGQLGNVHHFHCRQCGYDYSED